MCPELHSDAHFYTSTICANVGSKFPKIPRSPALGWPTNPYLRPSCQHPALILALTSVFWRCTIWFLEPYEDATLLEKAFLFPGEKDPARTPLFFTHFRPSRAPFSTIFGMCWVILGFIFAHFRRTTRPRWSAIFAHLGRTLLCAISPILGMSWINLGYRSQNLITKKIFQCRGKRRQKCHCVPQTHHGGLLNFTIFFCCRLHCSSM